ncbi:TadG family pilus assembly protein [Brevundimonas bullata]|uniref:TadG family pilus assembly protein n=1 Tax=Brevundimonas bullata TaxID=13160 RepID=UPI001FED00CB|nr:TadG family pilus assembly protein [Brevundimonas bullata]WQE36209.1 TadG family pilus assembly protein [Brevundimonas bullata]
MAPRNSLKDEGGGVAVMTALFGGVFCVLAALAVDVGSVSLKARQIQGAADLSAMAAAHDLARADAAAHATASANLSDVQTVDVVKGAYVADGRIKPKDRFLAGAADPNAARVEVTAPAPLFFGRWVLQRDSLAVRRTATAAIPGGQPQAMFSIGSRLASLDGGLANALLSGLLGSNVSLTVMDYRALAGAQVNLLQFSDALATEIGLTAGDYDALLKQEVTAGQALKVLESIAGADARSALSKLTRAPVDAKLKLKDLIGVEADAQHGLRQALNADVSALDLIMASLETANGDRQVALDLGARAGLADLDIMLAIGERPNKSPWLTITSKGEPIIRTAQTRIYLKATTAQSLAGLAQVKLPILIEAASSEARLSRINCVGAPSVTVAVRPGVARARIGAIDETKLKNFKASLISSDATILSALAGLVTITAHADLNIADLNWQEAAFNSVDISNQTTKSVRSRGFVNGLIVSLLQELKPNVALGPLFVGLGDLAKAVGVLLTPLGPVLDGVVQPLLDLLGLKLGEADVRVHGVQCPTQGRTPVLVG